MKKKVIIILSLLILGIVLLSVLLFIKNDKPEANYTEDEIKFKDEYENINGQELAQDYILKTISIDADNNVKYVSDDEILDLLTNGSNVIYFGWADCNWCRSVVPVLVSTLKHNNVETLYYYDLKSLRNSYENNNDEEKVKLYEDILDIIGKDIESVFSEDSFRSGEKKILAPTVVFVKNGVYLGLHVKSVDSQLKSTDDLSEEQTKELEGIYSSYINQINVSVCTDEGC